MLSEQQCKLIEKGLSEDVEPRKVAAYLCLHMGLTLAEICALRRSDIDLSSGTLAINHVFARSEEGRGQASTLFPSEVQRGLPIPPHALRYLSAHIGLYKSGSCFIISGDTELPAPHLMQNILTGICAKYRIAEAVSATDLRNSFIRRCLEAGIDLYSLCWFIGIRQPNGIVKKFSEYMKVKPESFAVTEQFSSDYTPPIPLLPKEPKRMNLLILGAGSQGAVVKEIADAMGVFQEIAYVDDDPKNKLAIDRCGNYEQYVNHYPIAIPSFGNCELRAQWADKLEKAGFILPLLIHPMATVSPSATLSEAVVVEAKAIIAAGVHVGRNCIISTGAVLEKSSTVEPDAHVGSACTVTKGSVVPKFSRVPAGRVFEQSSRAMRANA